jgi:hypothetical protein
MTKNDKRFIEFVKRDCKRHGIKCDLRNTRYVKLSNSIKCSGWFDSEGKRLVVSMNRPDALSILAHEYAHLTQWQDCINGKFKLWNTSSTSLFKVDEWLAGKSVRNIKQHLAVARDLELDNEKRTVELIKKYNLSIDITDYIKRANAYVHFYNWLGHTRRWCTPANSPYNNEDVISVMSGKFNMRYDTLSKRVYGAFAKARI